MRRMSFHSTASSSYDRPHRVPLLPVAAVAAALLVTGGMVMHTATDDPTPTAYDTQRAAVVSVLDDAIGADHAYDINVTNGVGGEAVPLP